MNLQEMSTEVLNDGLVIVGPIAEGRDVLPDLESGVELRLEQIRLIQEEDQVNVLQQGVRTYLRE